MKKKILVLAIGIFIALAGFGGQARAVLTDLVPCERDYAGNCIVRDGNIRPTANSEIPQNFWTLDGIITLIFNTIITISGVIFLIMLLIGGIQYLTGAGNEETTGKAKKMMIDAIVGLIIVLASWAIGTWILGRLS